MTCNHPPQFREWRTGKPKVRESDGRITIDDQTFWVCTRCGYEPI